MHWRSKGSCIDCIFSVKLSTMRYSLNEYRDCFHTKHLGFQILFISHFRKTKAVPQVEGITRYRLHHPSKELSQQPGLALD